MKPSANLRRNPHIALVISGFADGDERTVQYKEIADEPQGRERERVKQTCFAAWPDGREREPWPGLSYVRVRPTWIRYSDFHASPAIIVELNASRLVAAPADEH